MDLECLLTNSISISRFNLFSMNRHGDAGGKTPTNTNRSITSTTSTGGSGLTVTLSKSESEYNYK